MKDQLKQLISGSPDPMKARSLVREYCQARILQFLQNRGAFSTWIFHGGTGLRFLYSLPRYSEDLDFALRRPDRTPEFESLIIAIQRDFEAEAYNININVREQKTVNSAFLGFPGIWHELGLTPNPRETLSIKIELDTHPPAGGKTVTTIIKRFVLLNILHYDKSSFLSGKLHAILTRPYTKGRDLYDLVWYLSDPSWPGPNLEFLNSALKQTGWKGPEITWKNWPDHVARKIKKINWRRAVEDVRPFLENPEELALLNEENILSLLKRRSAR